MKPSLDLPKPWQRSRWTQAFAIIFGIAPIKGMMIMSHLNRNRPYSLDEILDSEKLGLGHGIWKKEP